MLMKFTDLWTLRPLPQPGAVVMGDCYRITVLTSRLLRLEYDRQQRFCDSATQMAICREFPLPAFEVRQDGARLTLETEAVRLEYDGQPFSSEGLSVTLKGAYSAYTSVWHYGDAPDTLGGTARTLDDAPGEIPLEDGLMSTKGYAVLDDSRSMRMDEAGNLLPAQAHGIDLYLFCYGHDYRACLRDYYQLSGHTPVLPRYALGNWWSRFYPYTEQSYMQLMERFAKERVPLSVAVLDMNWHTTRIDPKYGAPWTGYTWDQTCFPNPERMLSWLHAHGLRVTLNDHPADGVRACETLYPAMAQAMGMDPQGEAPIPYDAASPRFQQAFEQVVLEDFRRTGVDFWWIDWPQKGGSSKPGMDPLFTLNHTRYLYALRQDQAAMTFSRYGGPGSHRYPIGFSGDTHITWDALAFQPYFTATAANIGYGWWSHDIGGHMLGVHDDELAARWVQFGVFSPIMRLHSSPSAFMRKEPWAYGMRACAVMEDFMRLRHRLLPWLYTQNVRASETRCAFLRPVYYDYDCERFAWEGYRALRSEYLLGDGLLVCPITAPADADAMVAKTEAWLPEGEWVDFFTGHRYHGGRLLELYRPLEGMPVFARPGMIIPMDGAETPENGCPLPQSLLLRVFAGADGVCEVIEDNGKTPGAADYLRATTLARFHQGDEMRLEIVPIAGSAEIVPAARCYTVEIVGVAETLPDEASCGYDAAYDAARRTLILHLNCSPVKGAVLCWHAVPTRPALDMHALLERMLFPARMPLPAKDEAVRAFRLTDCAERIAELRRLDMPDALLGALIELSCVD